MRTRLPAAVVGLSVALTLIGCRQVDTRKPAAGGESSSQADTAGNATGTPSKQPEFIPSPNNLFRVRHMVLAVTLFTLYHELGHMIADDYGTPMIGQPENSADRFATLMMTPKPKPAGSGPDSFDPATDPDSPPVMRANLIRGTSSASMRVSARG